MQLLGYDSLDVRCHQQEPSQLVRSLEGDSALWSGEGTPLPPTLMTFLCWRYWRLKRVSINSYPFCFKPSRPYIPDRYFKIWTWISRYSMSIDTSSSDIWLFQNVTLKIRDEGHSSRSHSGSYILTTQIPKSFNANWPSHSWGTAISNFDLKNHGQGHRSSLQLVQHQF